MKPHKQSAEERAAEDLYVMYLRLLHDYEKLRGLYQHARAAIDNDLYIEDQLRRQGRS